jgi:hypothetical protein
VAIWKCGSAAMKEGAPCVAARRLTLREALGIVALVIAQAGNARPRFLHCRTAALSNCHIVFTNDLRNNLPCRHDFMYVSSYLTNL